jgi:dihydrofolate synthase/folylpolyglutamate synthase
MYYKDYNEDMNTPISLIDWINRIKSIHKQEVDLSLERVTEVAKRLNLLKPSCPVITIAGTNGKGSCVAGLEAIYLAQGYKTGAFTTPMLLTHNEQIRIQGIPASDEDFCNAYQRIENARKNLSLTQFEFTTLAALEIFQRANLDVWLLEVGLGGRWDAVNVIDADVAVITSIGIDHTEWLGPTRETIAIEKAGIFRNHHPAVCGDLSPPQSLLTSANTKQVPLVIQGKDFGYEENEHDWSFWSPQQILKKLPKPNLLLQNMATVLMTIEKLQQRLPVTRSTIDKALSQVKLPGRIEVIQGDITRIIDVSHNPAAAEVLANWLRKNSIQGTTRAVFSMLMDKDIPATLAAMKDVIDQWFIAPIATERGAPLQQLLDAFDQNKITNVQSYDSLTIANQSAIKQSKLGDRIIIFGSFRTVAEIKISIKECRVD